MDVRSCWWCSRQFERADTNTETASMEGQVGDKKRKFMTEDDECFNQATLVASKWILDFLFVSVCRRFKEGSYDAFQDAICTYDSVSRQASLKRGTSDEKTTICAFLARVMHGKQLDTHFEDDDSVMPLMSAYKVWLQLKEAVEDESLFGNVTVLLLIQSVVVCLEKGQRTSASFALKWFEEHDGVPQKLGAKLSTIVAQMDTYNPLLAGFSFNRLLEMVRSYLDTYLARNPSDYLVKEAIKTVRSVDDKDAMATEDTSRPEKVDDSQREETNGTKHKHQSTFKNLRICLPNVSAHALLERNTLTTIKEKQNMDAEEDARLSQRDDVRTKRKLLSTKASVWEGESQTCMRPATLKDSTNTSVISKARTHKKWTFELDKKLKDGVRRHGMGKWARILLDADFEGRTGTMLKDRWRVLVRDNKVN
ncbi:telomeric repeat-binding factor 1 [Dunckerocampus dactyliophorus]|uniref:telomeric repeat-binding factor 1 n=1 Tax=Dunckerocampus dactyliophorus TaxID=161453 RepID=UPI00240588B3|nr:telomeric repeat-binding factor 1 [Dunckerocampus dactyliophorus]